MKNRTLPVLATILIAFTITTHAFSQDIPSIEISGHSYWVNSVAFNPDGDTIASGSWDNTIRLWNTNNGTHISTLEGHRDSVNSVAFSPDGSKIVSGSSDRSIRLWDADSGTPISTITGHKDLVISVAFSPDGDTIASGSSDKTIRLWNANNGTHIRTITGHTYSVISVAFSPDRNTIASGSSDGTIRLWNANTGSHIRTITGHTDSVISVAFSPDGNTIASGSSDKTIRLWHTNTGNIIRTITGHTDRVYSVAFSPDGNTIVSGSSDNTMRLWNANTGTHIRTIEGHTNIVYSVAFSPDGKKIASGSSGSNLDENDITVRLWDVSTLFSYTVINITPDSVVCPAVGERINFNLGIVGGQDIRGYQFTVRYNSNRLKYDSHLQGEYLPGENVFIGPTFVTPEHNIPISDVNSDGTVDIADLIWVNQGYTRHHSTPAQVTFSATSPDGVGTGDGTLATITFEVLQRRSSTLIVSGMLSNSSGELLPIIVKYVNIIKPPWDVNGDGMVNILDLSFVAANIGQNDVTQADINGDGVVDIQDLVTVASGIDASAAAPAAYSKTLKLFTAADIQKWIYEAQQLNLTDPTIQRGIHLLQQLLASFTPKATALLPNYPNPFNPETWIPYQLATPADVSIAIYASDGKLVRTLTLGHKPVGIYQDKSNAAHWDGKNDLGEPVASAVYFYTLKAGDFTATRKMLIRK